MAVPGRVSRISNAIAACVAIHSSAALAVTCPEGSGRERVRATCASILRSVKSFQVHPAPRIRNAPSVQAITSHRS
jgi:hypothetical protein